MAILFVIVLTASCQATDVIKISEFHGPERRVSESISIVSWNAEKGADPQFKPDLARLIILNQPDFVFLQEASRNGRGINGSDWIKIDADMYSVCIDPWDYRKSDGKAE